MEILSRVKGTSRILAFSRLSLYEFMRELRFCFSNERKAYASATYRLLGIGHMFLVACMINPYVLISNCPHSSCSLALKIDTRNVIRDPRIVISF